MPGSLCPILVAELLDCKGPPPRREEAKLGPEQAGLDQSMDISTGEQWLLRVRRKHRGGEGGETNRSLPCSSCRVTVQLRGGYTGRILSMTFFSVI